MFETSKGNERFYNKTGLRRREILSYTWICLNFAGNES